MHDEVIIVVLRYYFTYLFHMPCDIVAFLKLYLPIDPDSELQMMSFNVEEWLLVMVAN